MFLVFVINILKCHKTVICLRFSYYVTNYSAFIGLFSPIKCTYPPDLYSLSCSGIVQAFFLRTYLSYLAIAEGQSNLGHV